MLPVREQILLATSTESDDRENHSVRPPLSRVFTQVRRETGKE